MSRVERRNARRHCWTAIASALLLAAFAAGLAGCKKEQPAQEQARRYHLVGKIVEVQTAQNTLIVDSQEIPGFMAAMTMPYPVRDAHLLANLGAGDEITADVVVAPDGAYLENIVVTKKGAGSQGPPATQLHQPQPGEPVPDFALINQDGKRIRLHSYRGDVLLVTFVYTRCPFPDFCPLVSHNFAEIYAATRHDTTLHSKIRLLTVSFDPEHDTPPVLRRYGETFRATTGGAPFDRWEFAVVPAKDLASVTNFFGLTYSSNNGQIVHSLSTTVISPSGAVFKWYDDNQWKPTDLVADATQALEEKNSARAAAHAHAAGSKSSTAQAD
jgi:protein SCO1/2